MYTTPRDIRPLTMAAMALLLVAGAAQAAGPSRDSADAQARYRQDMAVCDSGQSQQPVQACRAEARNALAAARRGKLTDAPDQHAVNAVQRCLVFSGTERTACESRVMEPSRLDGSVNGGGLLRESVMVVPAK